MNLIINPKTRKKYSIYSKQGKNILFNYLQHLKGGATKETSEEKPANHICRLNENPSKRNTCLQVADTKCQTGFYNTTNDKEYQEILKKRALNIKKVRCYTKSECEKKCGISTKNTIGNLSYKMLKSFLSIKDLVHKKDYKTLRFLLKKSMEYPLKGELLKLKKEIEKLNKYYCKKTLFTTHDDIINSLVVLPNGDIASSSGDSTIKIWNTTTYECKKTLEGHTDWIRSLVVLRNGDLASGSDDSTIKIWNTTTGQCKKTLKGPNYPYQSEQCQKSGDIYSLVVLPNGDLASGSGIRWRSAPGHFPIYNSTSSINIWNTTTYKCKKTLRHDSSRVRLRRTLAVRSYVASLVVLPNGDIASGSSDSTIKIWNTTTYECKKTLEGHTDWIRSLVVLQNGDLASSSDDRTIRIWDTTTGQCKKKLTGHTGWIINSLVVLPNGDLVSGSDDETIKIWDITTLKCKQTLTGHIDEVNSLVVLPNGDLASGSKDETIKIWKLNLNSKLLYETHYNIEEVIKKKNIEHINKLIYSKNIDLNKINYYISLTKNLKINNLLNDYLKSNLRAAQNLIKKEKNKDVKSLVNKIHKLNEKKYNVRYVKTEYIAEAPFKIKKTITKDFSKKEYKDFIKSEKIEKIYNKKKLEEEIKKDEIEINNLINELKKNLN